MHFLKNQMLVLNYMLGLLAFTVFHQHFLKNIHIEHTFQEKSPNTQIIF